MNKLQLSNTNESLPDVPTNGSQPSLPNEVQKGAKKWQDPNNKANPLATNFTIFSSANEKSPKTNMNQTAKTIKVTSHD